MRTVVLLNALQNLAHVYCTVANYIRSFCHHRTLATLVTVGSLVHYVSVNTHCKCMCCKQLCVCPNRTFFCACVCVYVCMRAEVTEVYDTMSCLPIMSGRAAAKGASILSLGSSPTRFLTRKYLFFSVTGHDFHMSQFSYRPIDHLWLTSEVSSCIKYNCTNDSFINQNPKAVQGNFILPKTLAPGPLLATN